MTVSVRANIVILLLCCAISAIAQESRLLGTAELTNTYFHTTEIEDSGAEFSQLDTELYLRYLVVEFSWRESRYMWKNAESLPFGNGKDPWNELHRLSLGLCWRAEVYEDWTIMGSTGGFAFFEHDIADSGGWYIRSVLHGKLQHDFTLDLGLFGAVNERAKEHDPFVPIICLSWRTEEEEGLFATLGFPYSGVGYRLNPKFSVDAGMLWANSSPFRLAEGSSLEPGGFVAGEGHGTQIGLSWKPSEVFGMRLVVGMVHSRELVLYDNRGDELHAYDVGPTPACKLELSGSF